MPTTDKSRQYRSIIERIFQNHWKPGLEAFEFQRDEMIEAAIATGVERPDNLGDVIYSFKFRRKFPESILATAPKGKSWLLEGAGYGSYRFRLVPIGGASIEPRKDLAVIKIPDSTPEIVSAYALGDEQALLAKVRYNRLIDLFLGLTTYSLQNHLRTHLKGRGQIEIDEIYIGLNRNGAHFVIPVQAKGGSDKLSPVQTMQDIECCRLKFPNLICPPRIGSVHARRNHCPLRTRNRWRHPVDRRGKALLPCTRGPDRLRYQAEICGKIVVSRLQSSWPSFQGRRPGTILPRTCSGGSEQVPVLKGRDFSPAVSAAKLTRLQPLRECPATGSARPAAKRLPNPRIC